MNHLETALRTLADDPFGEPAPANLADRALTRARTRRSRRGALSVVGAATVAVLVAVGFNAAANRPHPPAQTPSSPATPAFAKPRMNVLLIGSDAASNRAGIRPDTIVLSSIDTQTGATTLLSLPRAMQWVPFPAGTPGAKAWPKGFGCPEAGPGNECLLNAVWAWAEGSKEYRDLRSPGLTATKQVVEGISGLSVDETVVVSMQGLADLVDAVGGVDVMVRERLPIGGNSVNHTATGGWIEKGRQHLDGNQALWFARSRWTTSDYDRMLRQQCLIRAVTQQVDARTTLTRYAQIARALRRNLSTSIGSSELARWVDLTKRMQNAPITMMDTQVPGGSVHPDFAEIRRRVRTLTTTPRPAASAAVPDPTGTPGQAIATTPPGSKKQWLREGTC
ncbi:MAG TPA: LCP family protein [Kineosporiaceae bacterium]|nr:LCP family protein [Kineosporiaceae bacterium]